MRIVSKITKDCMFIHKKYHRALAQMVKSLLSGWPGMFSVRPNFQLSKRKFDMVTLYRKWCSIPYLKANHTHEIRKRRDPTLYRGLETLYCHITKTYDLGFSTCALVYRTSSYSSSVIKLSIIIRASTCN